MKLKDEEILKLLLASQTLEKGLRAMMDAYQSRLYWHIWRLIVDHDLSGCFAGYIYQGVSEHSPVQE